jgi:hypothetical protein
MRKMMLAAVGLVALAASSLAVAAGLHNNARSVKAVAGTFTAAGSSTRTSTCTTDDGKAIAVTNARYTGTALGDPDLAGAITIDAHSLINTTDDVGRVSGRLKIDVASGRDTAAAFDAIYDHGKLAGLAVGHAHDPGVRLLANLSAAFTASGGFTDGKIGGGTAGGSAIELGPARCKTTRTPKEKSEARGTVSAVSTTSITVAGLTCAVPADLAQKVGEVKVGDRAEIRCSFTNGQNTLDRISKKR